MNVLIACEFSATVRDSFRKRGHNAWSCDLLPCEGDSQWHYQGDVFNALKPLQWMNPSIDGWDLMIAHPPCTYLTVSANRWLKDQPPKKSGKLVGAERRAAREDAIQFFLALWNASVPKIAIENPIGCMNTILRPPDQIIHPYYFGHPTSKATCLWLENLPPLQYAKCDDFFLENKMVEVEYHTTANGKKYDKWGMVDACKLKGDERSKFRSKTFQGIADAMAEQWG